MILTDFYTSSYFRSVSTVAKMFILLHQYSRGVCRSVTACTAFNAVDGVGSNPIDGGGGNASGGGNTGDDDGRGGNASDDDGSGGGNASDDDGCGGNASGGGNNGGADNTYPGKLTT